MNRNNFDSWDEAANKFIKLFGEILIKKMIETSDIPKEFSSPHLIALYDRIFLAGKLSDGRVVLDDSLDIWNEDDDGDCIRDFLFALYDEDESQYEPIISKLEEEGIISKCKNYI